MNPRFWILDEAPFEQNFAEGMPEEEWTLGEAPRCPSCGDFIGMLPWLPPHRFRLSNTNYPDLLRVVLDWFISDRALQTLLGEGVTGLEVEDQPAEVLAVAGRPLSKLKRQPPVYYHVSFMLSSARIDERASHIVRKRGRVCSYCRSKHLILSARGLVIDPSTWDGMDMFRVVEWARIFVTDRAKDVWTTAGLTGVQFLRPETWVYKK